MVDNKKLREIYKGDFSKRQRFDDGGPVTVDYSSYLSSPIITQGDVDGATGLAQDQATAGLGNSLQSSSSSGGGSSGSSAATGALAKLLGLSGSSASGLAALAGLAGLAGAFTQNKSNPTISYNPPALFGGQAGFTGGNAGGQSTGFGPAGGYNHANYAGLTAKSSQAGLGYTPRTAITPNIPNYYTYGQGPQQSFFSASHKKGGLIKKYAKGGNAGTYTPPSAPPPPPDTPTTPQRFDFGGPVNATPVAPQPGMTGQPMPQQAPSMQATQSPVTQTPMQRPAPGVNPNPMLGHRAVIGNPSARPMMRAQGGGIGQAAVVTGNSTPLSQAFPQRTHWAGPSAANPEAAGHAEGGPLSTVSRHVVGPGDGTSDDIPARLANGEYVMDAQTVSMAGNGSNDAGAKKLDQFRANLRKHKGAALAKGKMAPDAHKDLMKYMGKK